MTVWRSPSFKAISKQAAGGSRFLSAKQPGRTGILGELTCNNANQLEGLRGKRKVGEES
jgi:hypothetical protein